jgi:hypothetical protein
MNNVDLMLGDGPLSNGNLIIENGDIVLTSGVESIRQAIQMRLRLIRGEISLDETLGIPYLEDVFLSLPDVATIRSLIRATIMGVEGIANIIKLNVFLDRPRRKIEIDFKASTADGAEIEMIEVVA